MRKQSLILEIDKQIGFWNKPCEGGNVIWEVFLKEKNQIKKRSVKKDILPILVSRNSKNKENKKENTKITQRTA